MTTLFSNSPFDKSFTINFFYKHAVSTKSAQLACPFFSDPEPIKILRKGRCENIRLIVRLCESTVAEALAEVRAIDGVHIRFFNAKSFHAKFYILGDVALVGSANMTSSGMTKNRELSVVIDSGDERFDEIPAFFDELWGSAGVLTLDAFEKFVAWRGRNVPHDFPPIEGIGEFSPPTIAVSTRNKNPTRTYLETFRSLYQERLLPAYRELETVYSERGGRHPGFGDGLRAYEIYQFLYWARGLTTNEDLFAHPLRTGENRKSNIRRYVSDWFQVENPPKFEESVVRIKGLKTLFADEDALRHVDMDTVTDLLKGCAAFTAMQRYAGGLEKHLKAFIAENRIEMVRDSFHHLMFGGGDYVQRIYDCLYLSKFKLSHFGRNCLLELFGWVNEDGVPPLNGRAIEALRFLGFDVPFLDLSKLRPMGA